MAGSMEIGSAVVKMQSAPATPAGALGEGGLSEVGVAKDNRRVKLAARFLQSDEMGGRVRADAGGWGTTPVNIRGKPIQNLSRTGGWTAALFIFGNEIAERVAYFGLGVNMVVFMFNVMHRPFSISENAVNNFLGLSQVSSVVGGFIADAYLGRYWTIAIFTNIYFFALTGITLQASVRIFTPSQDNCDKLSRLLGSCEQAKPWQNLFLYIVLYTAALGAAGIRPCVSSFGADQFDERRSDYKRHIDRFFNFFYLSVTLGAITALTVVVYIQLHHGWGAAFGFLAIAMGLSNFLFFVGTPLYRHRLPGGSPLTRVSQVLVAAFKKRNIPFSSSDTVGLYELPGRRSAIRGSEKIEHTDDFRFLDKAALHLKEDGSDPNPWRLCTVTQVEEVKILIKTIPIPACAIVLNLLLSEYLTLTVQQAYTLNTQMGGLKLPIVCMPVFAGLSVLIFLIFYYPIFVPLARRITGHPQGLSQLQRVGLGIVVSIISSAWGGVFERYRRHYAIDHGFKLNFLIAMPNLSAYWLVIQMCLIGVAEAFSLVGLIEFLYQEAPDAMRSIVSSYVAVAGGLGCFGATILNNIVDSITENVKEGRPSWLSQNINIGRFDYFYWLLSILSVLNFIIFLFCAKIYKYRTKKVVDIDL